MIKRKPILLKKIKSELQPDDNQKYVITDGISNSSGSFFDDIVTLAKDIGYGMNTVISAVVKVTIKTLIRALPVLIAAYFAARYLGYDVYPKFGDTIIGFFKSLKQLLPDRII